MKKIVVVSIILVAMAAVWGCREWEVIEDLDVEFSLGKNEGAPGKLIEVIVSPLLDSIEGYGVLFGEDTVPILPDGNGDYMTMVPMLSPGSVDVYLIKRTTGSRSISSVKFKVNPMPFTGKAPGEIVNGMIDDLEANTVTLKENLIVDLVSEGVFDQEHADVIIDDLDRAESLLKTAKNEIAILSSEDKKLVDQLLFASGIPELIHQQTSLLQSTTALQGPYAANAILVSLDGLSAYLSVVKAGLTVAGIAVAATGVGAPVGGILMVCSIAVTIVDNAIDGFVPTDLESLWVEPSNISVNLEETVEVSIYGRFEPQKTWASATLSGILGVVFSFVGDAASDVATKVITKIVSICASAGIGENDLLNDPQNKWSPFGNPTVRVSPAFYQGGLQTFLSVFSDEMGTEFDMDAFRNSLGQAADFLSPIVGLPHETANSNVASFDAISSSVTGHNVGTTSLIYGGYRFDGSSRTSGIGEEIASVVGLEWPHVLAPSVIKTCNITVGGGGGNNPPNTPVKPSGPSQSLPKVVVYFNTSTTDPDGDDVAFLFDWDDGNPGFWTDYVASGETQTAYHSYSQEGTYTIRVKAKDIQGAESGWSEGAVIEVGTDGEYGSISGYVVDATTGDFISGAIVCIDGQTLQDQTSDGFYRITDVPEGTYNLTASKSGYENDHVSGVPVQARQETSNVDFALNPGGEDRLKWKFTPPTDASGYGCPAIGSDGTIYWGAYNELYALYPSGSIKWSFPIPTAQGGANVSSPVIGSDNTIYFLSFNDYDCCLYALYPNGDEKWRYPVNRSGSGWSPAISFDGFREVICFTTTNSLYAVYADNGEPKWSRGISSGFLKSSPVIASDGTIYVGSSDGYLYAFTTEGEFNWEYWIGMDGDVLTPAIGADGVIYFVVGDFTGSVHAVYPNGSPKWETTLPEFGSYWGGQEKSPVLGSDGTIYIGAGIGNQSRLYALNPSNGDISWSCKVENTIENTPALGQDGLIYVGTQGSNNHSFYAISSLNHEIVWTYSTEGSIHYSATIASTDGTIYFASGMSDGRSLYALNSSSQGLANSPWPKFHHDICNTGRVGGP